MPARALPRSIVLTSLALLFAAAAPGWADTSHARVIRLSLVQGQVRFTRDFHHDPLADQKAVWEDAVLNLPIRQGYALATDNGRAEVEFENGAMAFLAENTVVEFYDLSLNDGAKTTRLVLRQGTGSFYVNPASEDYFSVTGGDFTVEASGRASFRLDNFDDGSVVNVSKGHVSVLRKDKTTLVAKGQSFSIRADDPNSATVGRGAEMDDFDHWVSGREDSVVTATNASQQYVSSPYYSSGFADLYTYGSWYPVSGYGYCWRPYGAGFGWSPFDNGGWYMDPLWGWGFIGHQPWGWLPYHYGGWIFDPVFGWLWSPGLGFGAGFGFIPFRPVTGVFVRGRTGLLGLVPAHPLDVRGKTPINLRQGVFPVTEGAVSRQIAAADITQNWKTLKAAPRDVLVSNMKVAMAAPLRVSRSIVAASASSRVSAGRNASIVYDPQERRFVNANSAPRAAANAASAKQGVEGLAAKDSRAVTGVQTVHGGVAPVAPRVNVPSAARATAPRSMTPPPAPRSSGSFGGGRGEAGGGWGGARASSPGATSHASSAAAGASHPAAGGGGRPH